ncbi:MAG: type II toxin-antitoxin system VapB family antitoxin [Cyanobacteria bacterium P01_F01_bin.33]
MGSFVRTSINIDDELPTDAQHVTSISEKNASVRAGLRTLIERESARRLALFGGSEKELRPISPRQSELS